MEMKCFSLSELSEDKLSELIYSFYYRLGKAVFEESERRDRRNVERLELGAKAFRALMEVGALEEERKKRQDQD